MELNEQAKEQTPEERKRQFLLERDHYIVQVELYSKLINIVSEILHDKAGDVIYANATGSVLLNLLKAKNGISENLVFVQVALSREDSEYRDRDIFKHI
ncbi:hypothetical protein [Paenibacillus sp. FSL H8-0283]|uniref:hypothetical protein n=1 Tax=Paenibacillus sp. FSL H8-0283 TaxID=2921383 RepID=UPI003245744E